MATINYPVPTVNDSGGIFEYFNYVNTVSDGFFFLVMVGLIWILVFINSKNFSNSRAFTYASFVSSILAILLALANLIAPMYMYLMIFMFASGLVWLKLEVR